ncbi:IS21 family transposase, partial [Streptomyces spectabilis]|uniref:Mu transposase domain-containing protein n=1 Tax=Streptomyces spectabilis TaxID=68270 RepID=UPI00348875D4
LPGRHFAGPDDFNAQLDQWLKVANRRQHRTLQARPSDRWEADKAGMLALPPVDPPSWWRYSVRLGRDHYVRVDTNDYSVDPKAIGQTVTVLCDNDQVLALATGGEIVAQHPRCWAKHQTLTDPEHAHVGGVMRREVRRQQAARATAAADVVEVEQRELGSYDRLFVIDGGKEVC